MACRPLPLALLPCLLLLPACAAAAADSSFPASDTAAGFAVFEVVPAEVYEGGGDTIVILGEGFVPGLEARIGGLALTGLEVLNDETVSGTVPSALPTGVHDVEVVQDDVALVLPRSFTVWSEALAPSTCGCGAAPLPPAGPLLVAGFATLIALFRRNRGGSPGPGLPSRPPTR